MVHGWAGAVVVGAGEVRAGGTDGAGTARSTVHARAGTVGDGGTDGDGIVRSTVSTARDGAGIVPSPGDGTAAGVGAGRSTASRVHGGAGEVVVGVGAVAVGECAADGVGAAGSASGGLGLARREHI
jgi:hypothetical protein